MDRISAGWMRERAASQMTLGKLIERLEAMPPETMIEGICKPHSYRGYYSDLAFERGEKVTSANAVEMCRGCMVKVFEGYKGGDFLMGRGTPVWLASYGCCGKKIIDVCDDGTLELADDDDD